MLASIGATKKQIKKNVISEGMILGAIGIPIGILSGIFADFVLIKIVNFLIGDYLLEDMGGIVFKITMMPIILSIVLGIITIYLSAITSARKASKVSPLELVRNSADIKIKNKKLKSPKIIKKIFKTGGVIAYKNLKRSKKKYRTTVISLVVSVFVFITMNSFIQYGFDTTDIYYKDYDYNIQIYGDVNELESIIKLDDVKDYTITYSAKESIEITDLSKLSDFGKQSLKDANWVVDSKTGEEHYEDATEKSLQILILDSDSFRDYAKKSGISYEQSKDKGILMDYYLYWTNNEKVSTERIYNFKLGDKISGKIDEKEYNIEIAGITKGGPRGNENVWYDGGILILNYDNDITKSCAKEAKGKVVFFSSKEKLDNGYIVDGDIIKECDENLRKHLLNTKEINIRGKHNYENICAAIAATNTLVDIDEALEVCKNFKGVEHRIEFVKEINGVKWYNDSASSSPTRTLSGINAFKENIILIAGGYDKNLDYEPLAKPVVDKVSSLILIGQTAEKIFDVVKGEAEKENKKIDIYMCDSLEQTIEIAKKSAKKGDIVLFSPASASFDMFKNFADRGEKFKNLVNNL